MVWSINYVRSIFTRSLSIFDRVAFSKIKINNVKSVAASRSSLCKYYIRNNTIHKHATMLAQMVKALDSLVLSAFCWPPQ